MQQPKTEPTLEFQAVIMHFYTATCRRSLSVFIFTEKQAQVENSLQANRNSFLVFLAKRVQVSQDSVGLSTKVN